MYRMQAKILGFVLIGLAMIPGALSRRKPPHIIIILIDDLGWNDLSFHGSDQIKTSNIDALAYSGMILNRHYVLPSCTPSRTALLTGYYPIHTGMQGYPLKGGENRYLSLKYKVMAEYLKELGYRTHLVGKWHLGFQSDDSVPNRRGFDTFFGYYNGYVDYFKFGYNQTIFNADKVDYYYGYDLHSNDEIYWSDMETYATTMFTERAVDVIRNHDSSEPLYLFFSHLATHTGDDEIGMEVPRNVNVNETYDHIKDYGRRTFAGCLEELDRSVGEVIKALNDKKMLEDSIILLASDNGGHTVSVDMPPNWSSNWPLAGTKFTLYEGGVRGAALIWSPLLPKGVVNDQFIHISDWLPTLYSAAGGDAMTLDHLDGIDQWKALNEVSAIKRDFLVLNIDEKIGAEGIIIDNRWKIVRGGFPTYGHYDYHWGKEENAKPNPESEAADILNSESGRIIRKLSGYREILNSKRISHLRSKSTVRCAEMPENEIPAEEGFVERSNDFRCPDYCIFDVIEDPCELRPLKNDEILRLAKRLIKDVRKTIVRQRPTKVDPESNPKKFGGVWMPWDSSNSADSFRSRLILISYSLFLLFPILYSFRSVYI